MLSKLSIFTPSFFCPSTFSSSPHPPLNTHSPFIPLFPSTSIPSSKNLLFLIPCYQESTSVDQSLASSAFFLSSLCRSVCPRRSVHACATASRQRSETIRRRGKKSWRGSARWRLCRVPTGWFKAIAATAIPNLQGRTSSAPRQTAMPARCSINHMRRRMHAVTACWPSNRTHRSFV